MFPELRGIGLSGCGASFWNRDCLDQVQGFDATRLGVLGFRGLGVLGLGFRGADAILNTYPETPISLD